jgi:methylated-DNA-[protein]-cysteine S-methyltransferase
MRRSEMEEEMAKVDREREKRYVYKMMDSPIGRLKLVATDEGLAGILWENDHPDRVRLHIVAEDNSHPVLLETERQLKEYFAGRRKEFAVTLDLAGTDFQRKVWNALLTIPFGETRSYGQIARQIGNPDAGRAVGAANGRNPVSIIAPCHRVIGSTGKLTGFAGGLDTKARLLALEGAKNESFTGVTADRASEMCLARARRTPAGARPAYS